ncbi:MAG TPA: 3-hydroxyacyl-ACP dehydratase FabZ family protein [Syntrophobacteraceae bacterium]|nr:3-hydroxyacyl-ACP dehydratase FabZ family protein [Syntrophobacteraceae bacterium]
MRYLLVDRIMAFDPGNKITGLKNVAMSEDFLEFHFPKNPIMPGIMLLEALVQLSGWLEAASSDFRKWFLVSRILKCSFYGFVLPGDQVELNVSVAPAPSQGLKVYSGSARVNGKRKIKAEFQGELIALDTIEEIEEQKGFFQILTRGNSAI